MPLTPLTDDLNIIQGLADEPNNTLTSEQLKAKFDQAVLTIKDYLNNTLLPELDASIGLFSDIAAIDDSTLTNNADHIPASSVVKAALTGATAARLAQSRRITLTDGVSGTADADFSSDVSIPVTEINPAYLSSPVPVGCGGTGATTAEAARASLGVSNADIANVVYPVGSIYISTNTANPGALFGVGTWARIKDKFLLAAGDVYNNGESGGEAAHTLTTSEIPSHRHSTTADVHYYSDSGSYSVTSGGSHTAISSVYTSYSGGGAAHNNMPPYLAVYVWQRTA